MGCRWNRLDEPVFVAVSFFELTGNLYLEYFTHCEAQRREVSIDTAKVGLKSFGFCKHLGPMPGVLVAYKVTRIIKIVSELEH